MECKFQIAARTRDSSEFSLNPFDLKSLYFYTPFRARERWCSAGIAGERHEYSLSARLQVLIKKSGRTIERLAPSNSEVVNLKCFSFEVTFIYHFICLKK